MDDMETLGENVEKKPFIRLLRADEIECRVAMVNEKGLSLLLFKDARVDQKILDETFTPFGWKRTHQEIGGNLYCTVEIWDGDREQWISKQDVGTESYSEKEKGQASDSFKRACFNWGMGRELYTAPFIWIPASRTTIEPRGDKYYCKDRFTVAEIAYSEGREICSLTIVNSGGTVVYSLRPAGSGAGGYGNLGATDAVIGLPSTVTAAETAGKAGGRAKTAYSKAGTGKAIAKTGRSRPDTGSSGKADGNGKTDSNNTGLSLAQTAELERELKRTGVSLQTVLDRYQIASLEQMTVELYESAMRSLRKSSSRSRKAA